MLGGALLIGKFELAFALVEILQCRLGRFRDGLVLSALLAGLATDQTSMAVNLEQS